VANPQQAHPDELYCRRQAALYGARVSPTVRRWIASVLLLAGIAVAALAIADVGPFEDPVTEEERAQQAVQDFFAAAERGDGKAFCALLTPEARNTLEIQTAQRLQTDEPPKCDDLSELVEAAYEESSIDVRYVNVSGTRARVETRYRLAGHGAVPRTVLLEQNQGGEWHVSDPGSS
jgi:predicted lipid-binding transport protein (Tim44 family)